MSDLFIVPFHLILQVTGAPVTSPQGPPMIPIQTHIRALTGTYLWL